ncbi:F-box protein-like protein isoform X1 [Tanacetum coccineum]
MDTIATGLHELSLNNEELPLSIHKVESSYDMLNEILLKLHVTSLILFKSVSKRWLSLIKDATFIKRQSPKIDPPSGLLNQFRYWPHPYGSVSFDIRIPLRDEKIFKTVSFCAITFLQSCNGLFLCSVIGENFCVYNPTVNLFENHREEEDQEGNNSPEIETLTYHVLAQNQAQKPKNEARAENEPRARTSQVDSQRYGVPVFYPFGGHVNVYSY